MSLEAGVEYKVYMEHTQTGRNLFVVPPIPESFRSPIWRKLAKYLKVAESHPSTGVVQPVNVDHTEYGPSSKINVHYHQKEATFIWMQDLILKTLNGEGDSPPATLQYLLESAEKPPYENLEVSSRYL